MTSPQPPNRPAADAAKPEDHRPDLYRVAAMIGLFLLCFGQHQQGLEQTNLILGLFGGWIILFPRPRMPMVFLIAAACLQIYVEARMPRGRLLFEPNDIPLAAGMLIFLACAYRLVALRWHITPDNPRAASSSNRPLIPRSRQPSDLNAEEGARLILLVVVCTLAGEVAGHWLSQHWTTLEFSPRFVQLASFLWLGILGVFLAAGISGYWRAVNSDPERARLLLQEVVWRDARRDYGRIGRWLAWGKEKVQRRLDAERKAAAKKP